MGKKKWKYGEYIRTEQGEIAKVIDIINKEIKFDKKIRLIAEVQPVKYSSDNSYIEGTRYITKIPKHSKNIIDLIEPGDYINGELVGDIINDNEIITNARTTAGIDGRIICKEDIKSIVTKEQYAAIEYKIEAEGK